MKASHPVRTVYTLLSAFLAGAGIMVVEMAGNRVLAPVFGNSLYTWTGLIGVILLSISVGYYLGGWLADKYPNWRLMAHMLALSSVTVLAIPYLQGPVESTLDASRIVWGPILAGLLLFMLPGLLMGTIAPIAIRLTCILHEDKHIGISAGQIGMVGTIGSVLGTFAGGFLLIPLLSLHLLFLLIAGILAILSLIGYLAERAGKKLPAAVTLVLIVFGGPLAARTPELPQGVIHEESTFYHRIRIGEVLAPNGGTVRTIDLDSTTEGAVYMDRSDLPLDYQNFWQLVHVFSPSPESAVFIGGGGFGMPQAFHQAFPEAETTVVELDPRVIELGREYLKLGAFPGINAVAADARQYLNQRAEPADLVFGDAYHGVQSIPAHLVTREFFLEVKQGLTEDGVFMMNMVGAKEGPQSRLYEALVNTLSDVFDYVHVFHVQPLPEDRQRNHILAAMDRPLNVSQALRTATDLAEEVKNYFISRYDGPAEPGAGERFTDQRNPVEYIVARARLMDPGH